MRATRLVTLSAALLLVGCADGDGGSGSDGPGRIQLDLTGAPGGWFRVQVFRGPVTSELRGQRLFDAGCRQKQRNSFRIDGLSAGEDRTVVFESFASSECAPDGREAIGYRGDIMVPESGEMPRYFIPVFPSASSSALPANVNLSASTSLPVDFCETDQQCRDNFSPGVQDDLAPPEDAETELPGGRCIKDAQGSQARYWCVPSCSSDAECRDHLHPRSHCDVSAGWCKMRSLFPLNLGEPRAFGHAAAGSEGDVLLFGGLGEESADGLGAVEHGVVRFDMETGLFERVELEGGEAARVGMAGFAAMDEGRYALAGGVRSARVRVGDPGGGSGVRIRRDQLADAIETHGGQLAVVDLQAGAVRTASLPAPRARPAVVARPNGRIFVIGGLATREDGDVRRTRNVWRCRMRAEGPSCEAFAEMGTRRGGAAAACLDSACDRILVVGGNRDGSVASLIEPDSSTVVTSLGSSDLPDVLREPMLCGRHLVGGKGDGQPDAGLEALTLSFSGEQLTGSPPPEDGPSFRTALQPATASMEEGACWVGGGLAADGSVRAAIRRVTPDGVGPSGQELEKARFGAQAAPIQGGPLAGSVLYAGGLTLDDGGNVIPVDGAEVLRP